MTSSAPSPEAVARLVGGAVHSMVPLGGGRNSQVFCVEAKDGQRYALKAYFRHPGDARDRLGVEFGALSFLWGQGLRGIPKPVAKDAEAALGLFEFIPGERPMPPEDKEMDEASAFLAGLKLLAGAPGAKELPEASEACFSLQALVDNIELRFHRLATVEPGFGKASGLEAFLNNALQPSWQALLLEVRAACQEANLSFAELLPLSSRTLSPSDFGFHNALRTERGLVFLDFEYFGWDDPAKTLADFLLHPALDLTLHQRQRFAQAFLEKFAMHGLAQRTRLLFPLYGIKWCLILLNEFLPGPLHRRAFADPSLQSAAERQACQLTKAQNKLQQLLDDHAHFPYFSH